ncbi:hypothetical protein BRD00_07545 [Halobacteriales archaeon QS_8_69_26]|nr:MAG: hypothetical protein BRD00_07545 [Halobacteriales archaeon QS_8_69_26]
MELTPETVAAEREWVRGRAEVVVPLINRVRTDLEELFDADVETVSEDRYREEVDLVFADGDVAVNVAALVGLLRELDVQGDYPGFVVDEVLGRELAGTIGGDQPLRLLGEATFHYADLIHPADTDLLTGAEGDEAADPTGDDDHGAAGLDDLDAALAAGFQTRLPGWGWTDRPSPFDVPRDGD